LGFTKLQNIDSFKLRKEKRDTTLLMMGDVNFVDLNVRDWDILALSLQRAE